MQLILIPLLVIIIGVQGLFYLHLRNLPLEDEVAVKQEEDTNLETEDETAGYIEGWAYSHIGQPSSIEY